MPDPDRNKPKRVLTQQQKDIINAKARKKQQAQVLDQLAAHVTQRLCCNGLGDEAVRLQLRGPAEEDLGGYVRGAVQMQIREALKLHYGV
jgi:hypothetical protein